MTQRVINFSGGRTSAMMTILEYKQGDIVLFCDTGREHPKTYKFIHDFEAYEKIPVVWLKYEGGFERLIEKYQAVPNRFMRFCTKELKAKTARRYLRSLGITSYFNLIGFRADEQLRIKRNKNHWKKVINVFPLNSMGITKPDVIRFWAGKKYDLETPSILGNCTLCFQKGKNAIISIMQQYPELANEWIADEERQGNTYFKDMSMKEMLELSKKLKKQTNLFELEPAYNCACTT